MFLLNEKRLQIAIDRYLNEVQNYFRHSAPHSRFLIDQ